MAFEVSLTLDGIGATKSRDKRLSMRLTHPLCSYPKKFTPKIFMQSVDRVCHTYISKHKPSLCFQTSVATVLAHTPYILGPLEPHLMTVRAISKGILPIPLATLHEGAVMDRNTKLSQHLILALTSDARDLDSALQSMPALPSP